MEDFTVSKEGNLSIWSNIDRLDIFDANISGSSSSIPSSDTSFFNSDKSLLSSVSSMDTSTAASVVLSVEEKIGALIGDRGGVFGQFVQ